MELTICTIGFAGKTAEQFFHLLTRADVKKVIDVRENRGGQLSGFAKYPDLAFFLERVAGIAYAYEPRLAPSPEIREAYRATKDWPAYESSFLQLMRDRDIPRALEPLQMNGTTALLCSEPGPEKCHRRLVAELLAGYLRSHGAAAAVRHLAIEKPTQPKRKRTKRTRHDGTVD